MPEANNQSLANGLGVNPLFELGWERVSHQRVSLAIVGAGGRAYLTGPADICRYFWASEDACYL